MFLRHDSGEEGLLLEHLPKIETCQNCIGKIHQGCCQCYHGHQLCHHDEHHHDHNDNDDNHDDLTEESLPQNSLFVPPPARPDKEEGGMAWVTMAFMLRMIMRMMVMMMMMMITMMVMMTWQCWAQV